MDLPVSDRKKEIYILGCICGENTEMVIWDDIAGKIKKDLRFLGISFRKNTAKIKKGEYRIAIYSVPTLHDCPLDFHIVRQDADGM